MKEGEQLGFEVLENVFRLEYGHTDVYYLRNFLFILGVFGNILWLLASGRLLTLTPSVPENFVLGLNYLLVFTLLSYWVQGVTAKKLITIINFVIGFMTISEWLGYDMLSVEAVGILLAYIIASIWIYGLVGGFVSKPTSYSSILVIISPISTFGLLVMLGRNPLDFMWVLMPFLLGIGVITFLKRRILEKIVEALPKFPFLVPKSTERSYFDVLNIAKMYSSASRFGKPKRGLFFEHVVFFLCSPVILFLIVSLLNIQEAQEENAKKRLLQYIRESPVIGIITPEEGARVTKTAIASVARYLCDLARQNGWKKFSGRMILFADPNLRVQKDLEVLELSEDLSEIDLYKVPPDLRPILNTISFSYNVDTYEKLVQMTGAEHKHLQSKLRTLEQKGFLRLVAGHTEPRSEDLKEILQAARKRYEDNFVLTLDNVSKALAQRHLLFSRLPDRTKITVGLIVTKVLLANSDLFEKEFIEVSKRTDYLFKQATNLERTVTSYHISKEMQKEAIRSIFHYVRDDVKTRVEEPFGERVRWPWTTMREGGDCDCKTVLIASMLVHLGFDVRIVIVPPSLTIGHSFTKVLLYGPGSGKEKWWDLDPSDYRCEAGEISPEYKQYEKTAFLIDLSSISDEIGLVI